MNSTSIILFDHLSTIIKRYSILIRYCLIGVTGVSLDFIIFFLLTTKCGIYYQFTNVLSVSCGIANNFILNAFFNFKVKNNLRKRFLIFYSVGISGLILSGLLLFVLVELIGGSVLLSKGITIIIVTIMQFNLNKYFTFAD